MGNVKGTSASSANAQQSSYGDTWVDRTFRILSAFGMLSRIRNRHFFWVDRFPQASIVTRPSSYWGLPVLEMIVPWSRIARIQEQESPERT
jgi:hypothetical protein